jgi:hypothetical protein
MQHMHSSNNLLTPRAPVKECLCSNPKQKQTDRQQRQRVVVVHDMMQETGHLPAANSKQMHRLQATSPVHHNIFAATTTLHRITLNPSSLD